MLKISIDLILKRKKWLFLFVSTFILVISSVIALQMSAESIKNNLKENAMTEYGGHTAVLLDIEDDLFEVKEKADKVGAFYITDSLELSDLKMSVGWFDDQALQISRIRLKEGNLPENEHEIVIEEAYLTKINKELGGNWELGEERVIHFAKGEKTFILTGILHNYSSQWTLNSSEQIKGFNRFPNILVGEQPTEGIEGHNYLIEYLGKVDKSIVKAEELLTYYDDKGFLNERYLNDGLLDYYGIALLAVVFKYIILFLSILSLINILTYFNHHQLEKIGVLKTQGATNKDILMMKVYQYLFLIIISSFASIPFIVLIFKVIVKYTYDNGDLNASIWSIISSFLVPLVCYILFLIIKTFMETEKIRGSTVIKLLKNRGKSFDYNLFVPFKNRVFKINSVSYLVNLVTVTLSLITILFSFFLHKESAGIWDTDLNYYLTANETIQYGTQEGKRVVLNEKEAFNYEDIKHLEELKGVKEIEKTAFNFDLATRLDKGFEDNEENSLFENIEVFIMDEYDLKIKKLPYNYEELKGKALVYTTYAPGEKEFSKNVGENVYIERKNNNEELEVWVYEVLDVVYIEMDNKTSESETTIFLDLETATTNHLFDGYNEIKISLEENVSKNHIDVINQSTKEMAAVVPGSLYQNISEFKVEDNNIYYLMTLLSILTFIISIILSSISLFIMVIGKYEENKHVWAIYLSLGMSRKNVSRLLISDIYILLTQSAIVSGLAFVLMYLFLGSLYSLLYYFKFYLMTLVTISLIFFMIWLFINFKITRDSISNLLRQEE